MIPQRDRGLYNKYRVRNVETKLPVEGAFVLRPDRDPAALIALKHYAEATTNVDLAADLILWIEGLEQ